MNHSASFGKCPILGILNITLSVGDYIPIYPQYLGDVQLGHLPTPELLNLISGLSRERPTLRGRTPLRERGQPALRLWIISRSRKISWSLGHVIGGSISLPDGNLYQNRDYLSKGANFHSHCADHTRQRVCCGVWNRERRSQINDGFRRPEVVIPASPINHQERIQNPASQSEPRVWRWSTSAEVPQRGERVDWKHAVQARFRNEQGGARRLGWRSMLPAPVMICDPPESMLAAGESASLMGICSQQTYGYFRQVLQPQRIRDRQLRMDAYILKQVTWYTELFHQQIGTNKTTGSCTLCNL